MEVLENMNTELEKLREEITEMKDEIKNLAEEVGKLTRTCSRMNSHINFVNGVYSTVRKPADYLLGQVRYWMGASPASRDLPPVAEKDRIEYHRCCSTDEDSK